MTNTMKKLTVLLIGTLFLLCVAIVLAVGLPARAAFAEDAESSSETEATVHDHTDGTWTALTTAYLLDNGTTLTDGQFYLEGNMTVDITIDENATVTLCLNGYKITGTGEGAVITVNAGANFTLEDCKSASESAECQHNYYVAESGLWVFYDGALPSTAPTDAVTGTVTGGVVTGGVYGVYINSGTFTMTDGTISGNTSSSVNGVYGAVYVSGGTFNMNSGKISGNTGSNVDGVYGVYVYGGAFTMNGGTISDNSSSNAKFLYGVCLYNSSTFTMTDGVISDNTGIEGGGVYVRDRSTFNLYDGTISCNTGTDSGYGVFTEVDCTFNMYDGTISGNSGTDRAYGVGIYEGTFNMHGGTISDNLIGGVLMYSINSIFNMYDGTISNNSGDGVYMSINNMSFTMEGGTISGNTGYGVRMTGSMSTTFNMNGGAISDNLSGGVSLNRATFTMSDGSITGNTGDGVSLNSATFTMSDGSITGNTGAGVDMTDSTFTMSGGDITGNTSSGVNMAGGTFTVSKFLVIKDNTLDGAVCNVNLVGTGTKITVGGSLYAGATIGVTAAQDTVFVSGLSENNITVPEKFFLLDDPTKGFELTSAGEAVLVQGTYTIVYVAADGTKTETVYNLGADVTLEQADSEGNFDWSLNKESLTADYASGATISGGLSTTHGEVITLYAVEKNFTASDIVLRVTDTYIQWKYSAEDDNAWRNLVALTELTGADGQDGVNGADGADGQDGVNGTDGADGITPELRINSETNMWEVSYDNGASWTSLNVSATGADGQDGTDGVNGADGQSGGTVALYVLTSISLAGLIAMAVILIIKRKTLSEK